jgi:subtilisin family serine protease
MCSQGEKHMNRIIGKVPLRIAFIGSLLCLIVLAAGSVANAEDASGGLLVKLSAKTRIDDMDRDHHAREIGSIPGVNLYVVKPANRRSTAALRAELTQDPRVLAVENNLPITVKANEYYFAKDGGFGGCASGQPYNQVDYGFISQFVNGSGVVVALLDTGIDFNHPALIGHFIPGYNFINNTAYAIDLPDNPTNPAASPGTGHGTFNAGIITQMAPGAMIMPLKVLNGQGQGTLQNVIAAIYWAIANNANIIHMSFSAAQSSPGLNAAIRAAHAAGIIVVASAGNEASANPDYPAGSPYVQSVAAVNSDNTLAPFSNYGNSISFVAPGNGIRSTFWNGGYAIGYGTSFAAPFVTGLAALLLSAQSNGPNGLARPGAVIAAMQNSAYLIDPLNPGYAGLLGFGLIDCDWAFLNLWGY